LKWLRRQLQNLRRTDLVRETELPADVEAKLAEVPFGEGGIGIDGLRALARETEDVRARALRSFLPMWKDAHIRDLTGFLIGAIKKAQKDITKEVEAKEMAKPRSKAASSSSAVGQPTKRPAGGWIREDGKPLEEVQIGDRVGGVVTNVVRERVWVNVGFKKDVTFQAPSVGAYVIGDQIEGLKVSTIDLENTRVEVILGSGKALDQTAKASKDGEASSSSSKSPPETKAKAAAASQAEAKSQGRKAGATARSSTAGASPKQNAADKRPISGSPSRQQRYRAAAAPVPKTGWGHAGGRNIAELTVGEAMDGTVTNVLYTRVWVNIGAAKDASFSMEGDANSYKVGDQIIGLPIKAIDLDKGHVILQPPSSN
jgi:hypothetical protein